MKSFCGGGLKMSLSGVPSDSSCFCPSDTQEDCEGEAAEVGPSPAASLKLLTCLSLALGLCYKHLFSGNTDAHSGSVSFQSDGQDEG